MPNAHKNRNLYTIQIITIWSSNSFILPNISKKHSRESIRFKKIMEAGKAISFTKPTLKFCIAGMFIPGFTAIVIFGLQQAIQFLGIECAISWRILWTLTTIGAIVSPIVFYKGAKKKNMDGNKLTSQQITIFNIIEYTLLQCTFAALFTKGHTLCYVSDGQNGLELVLAWIALPILII